jgi:Uma2 family endonuclease
MTAMSVPPGALVRLNVPEGFQPAWEIVSLFPSQGEWTEEDYLALNTNHLVELVDGRIEVLPMPTEEHQSIIAYLYELLAGFARPRHLGKVLFAGLRVKLRSGLFREPDVVFLAERNRDKRGNQFWRGADLVIEVVSPDDPDRDYVNKRAEYAACGIPEYWIADPRDRTIRQLLLEKQGYAEQGVFRDGQQFESAVLPGLKVDVSAVFDSAND